MSFSAGFALYAVLPTKIPPLATTPQWYEQVRRVDAGTIGPRAVEALLRATAAICRYYATIAQRAWFWGMLTRDEMQRLTVAEGLELEPALQTGLDSLRWAIARAQVDLWEASKQ